MEPSGGASPIAPGTSKTKRASATGSSNPARWLNRSLKGAAGADGRPGVRVASRTSAARRNGGSRMTGTRSGACRVNGGAFVRKNDQRRFAAGNAIAALES